MMKALLLLVLLAQCAWGQTGHGGITGRAGADYNFTAANTTSVCKTGTSVPGTCGVGECFFDTDATAGENLFGCTSTNVWTLLGGGTSTILANQSDPFECERTSATVLTCNVDASASAPILIGGAQFTSPFTITIDAGSETGENVFPYYSPTDDVIYVSYSGTLGNISCSGCTKQAGSAFPALATGDILGYNWPLGNDAAGEWDTVTPADDWRSGLTSQQVVVAGTGASFADSGAVRTISIDSAVYPIAFCVANEDTLCLIEEMAASGTNNIGQLTWHKNTFASGNGTGAYSRGDANHPGVVRLTAGATDAGGTNWSLGVDGTATRFWEIDDATFDLVFYFQIATADIEVRLGIFSSVADETPPEGLYLRMDQSADTNFIWIGCEGSVCSDTHDTGVAADFTWHKARIRSTTAGTLLTSFDDGTERSWCAAACDETWVPANDESSPVISLVAETTESRFVEIDAVFIKADLTR